MAEKWEKREETFSYFEQEVYGWEVVEAYGAAYTTVALCFDEKDADRILLDHELARLAEEIHGEGFLVRPRVGDRGYDCVDCGAGDSDSPTRIPHAPTCIVARLRDALKAQATGEQ